MFTVSLSGKKALVLQQIEQQVSDVPSQVFLKALVDTGPGTTCSISGSMTSSPDGSHGTLSLSGSFWTPQT